MYIDPTRLEPCALELAAEEALVVVGLAAVSSDGDVEDIELTALVEALETLEILPDLDEDAREDFVLRVVGLCDLEGLGPVLGAALRSLTDEASRLLALELTVEVLVADGQIPDSEVVYLHAFKDVLGIGDADFLRVTHAEDEA